MSEPSLLNSTFILKIHTLSDAMVNFADWQAKFRSQISQALGFSSLEIQSPSSLQSNIWLVSLRFTAKEYLDLWLKSPQYASLLKELADENIITNQHAICNETALPSSNGVTEVYVTLVDKAKRLKFNEWHKKIHKVESTFPGFQKVYIQAPDPKEERGTWITLLQFDKLENLEHWLNSPQRKEMLKESEEFVTSKETHRLFSSFGGWFNEASLSDPPRWKQTMLILVFLYPIVMIQSLYLSNHLWFLKTPLKTFVENVMCVSLLAWPLLPMGIYILRWWFKPGCNHAKNFLGSAILLLVYAIEIIIFFKLT